jgi:hypothetical protein
MSTKTTFKRVALVAVAALGLGVLATAPSQATVQASSLTLSAATSTQLTNETSSATAAVATLSFLASNLADTVTITAYLMSAPATNTKTPVMQVSETSSAVVRDDASGGSALAVGAEETDQTISVNSSADAATSVTAKVKVYMNSATVAGTYVVKLVPSVSGGGGVIDTTGVTLTITVSANPATDTVASSATSIITTAADTTTATDVVVTGIKTAGGARAANIRVGLLNAAGVATIGESFTATITGPGLLGSETLDASLGGSAIGRAITVKVGDVVTVFPDGSSGVSTVTISSALGKVLATETLTFFGAVATITTTVKIAVIGGTSAVAGVLAVSAKDSAGTNVSGISSFGVVSSDTTKIATVYGTSVASYDATTGLYLIPVTPVAAGSANLTVTTNTSSTDTTGVSAAVAAVRVGSKTPAAVKVTLDKSVYAPGEKATVTVALTDSTALDLVGSETYTAIFATGGITTNQSLSANSADLTGTGTVSYAAGGKTYTIYMPLFEGDVTFSWTTGSTTSASTTGLALANQAIAGSVVASVSSVSGSAAIDAANEATDAANAATDAALAAADAADAATAAAEDASAAVATLAASVNTALANLKKQITALTALVNKLLKK